MRYPRFLLVLGLLILGIVLTGCFGPVITPPDDVIPTPRPGNYGLTGTTNFIPNDPDQDPYPLFVGARWLYHNAAKFWNPDIVSSGLLETEVVAVVQGNGVQCYVLETQYSNGPDELLYMTRTRSGVMLYGEAVLAASGSQPAYSLHPALAILELPLLEDKSWPLRTSQGAGEAYVYHPEVVAIESGVVHTQVSTLPAIFVGAWRVHYQLPAGGPRFYGGPVQFLWYAPGVGVVKHVLNSVDYELAEFRLHDEVVTLTQAEAGRTMKVQHGGIVTVQLRGDSDPVDGWAWQLTDIEGTALRHLSSDFYADVYPVSAYTGTYAFQFRAGAVGSATLEFKLVHADTGIVGGKVKYTIDVK